MSGLFRIRILILLISISTMAPIILTDVVAANIYLFSTTFTDQTLNDWTIVDAPEAQGGPSNWTIAHKKGSLVLQQSSNIYKNPNFEGSYVYAGESTWTDYHLNVDINADDNDSLFVMFRYINDDNFYRLIVNKQQNFRRLEKKVAGAYITLDEDLTHGYESDRWNNIYIKVIGNNISVFFGYEEIFHINDNSLIAGKIGLGTHGCQNCYFDNVIISPNDIVDPYADIVMDANIKISGNIRTDPTRSLGRPYHCFGCGLAIGGPGYWVNWDMGNGEEIINGLGNDLRVYEIGFSLGGTDEEYEVYVSNSPTGPWTFLGQGSAVSEFDLAKINFDSVRYVHVEDLSTKTNASSYPGSDIDAIQALHLPNQSPITTPQVTSVSQIGNDVKIEWLFVSNAIGYNVYAYSDPGISNNARSTVAITKTFLVNSLPITTTEYIHSNAANNGLSYAVTSIDPVGFESGFGILGGKKIYLPFVIK